MVEFEAQIKKWGNSLAVILPKDRFKGKFKVGKKIRLISIEDVNLSKEFGSLKNILKKPTEQIMKEIDEGWS